MTRIRRTAISLAVVAVSALGIAAPALADKSSEVIVEEMGCGTQHTSASFTLSSPAKVEIEVVHRPGAWGTSGVLDAQGHVVWSFTQPMEWIWGYYKVQSETLPAGQYEYRYWARNTAQLYYFCHGTVRQVSA